MTGPERPSLLERHLGGARAAEEARAEIRQRQWDDLRRLAGSVLRGEPPALPPAPSARAPVEAEVARLVRREMEQIVRDELPDVCAALVRRAVGNGRGYGTRETSR